MKRGQGAVLDAMILMIICASASALLLYVGELYGSNSNKQILTIYNYEYANVALLALRGVKDDNNVEFWTRLGEILAESDALLLQDYLQHDGRSTFLNLADSAPGKLVMIFKKGSELYCYKDDDINEIYCKGEEPQFAERFTTYAVATALKDKIGDIWDVTLEIRF